MRLRHRERGSEGFAGGFAGLLFGFLIFLVGTLIVAYAWSVVETKAAVVDAARQAARTYVEAPDAGTALVEARQAADGSLSLRGRDPRSATVALSSGSFGRCERITISVSYPAPSLRLPVVHALGGSPVRAEHSEIVDPFRSGLVGSAAC